MAKKRRSYGAEFKLDTVMEGLRGETKISEIWRECGISEELERMVGRLTMQVDILKHIIGFMVHRSSGYALIGDR